MPHRLLPLSLLLLALSAAAQENSPLHAGPMLGPVTHRDATVWMQTAAPAEVRLRYYVEATADGTTPRAIPVTTAPVETTPEGDHPDLMLWLGDNVYLREVDWWSPAGIAYRYRHARAKPALQRLLAAAPHYATWNDHDYGPNDADRSYALKGAALETFARYWPNPTYGLPGVPTQFQFADAEFFLLDDRYHRTPNATPEDAPRTILGAEQRQWLIDALTFSRAPFKFVVIGGQVLNPVPVFEVYSNVAPEERDALLAEIERRGIEGVVFLSGDRHHSELMRMEREGAYPLYELTSSPLTAGAVAEPRDAVTPIRVDGTLVAGQHAFGTITVEGSREARTLTLRAHDAAGAVLWEHRIEAGALRMPAGE